MIETESAPYAALADRLAPDELWNAIRPLLPHGVRRPQGGGKQRENDRALLVAVVYMALTGTPWRKLPPWCGVSRAAVYRRFTQWAIARVWEQLLDSLGPEHEPDCWCRIVARLVPRHIEIQSARRVGAPDGHRSLAYRVDGSSIDAMNATHPGMC